MIRDTLFDRIIDVELYYVKDDDNQEPKTLRIKCPRQGRKPRITIEWSQIPSEVCYGCKLTIGNLWMSGLDAIWVDKIKVTLGYASDDATHRTSLEAKVFNGYTPAPGPDGYTVFEAIIATAGVDALYNTPYSLSFFNNNPETDAPWTISDVIYKICKIVGFEAEQKFQDGIAKEPFSADSIPYLKFGNGYAVISWLQQQLNAIGASKKDPKECFTVSVFIFDKKIYFLGIYADNSVRITLKSKEATRADNLINVPKLNLVTNVDWNAGVLKVKAPYVPEVKPGTLFTIEPRYWQGSKALPNQVARQNTQKDANNLYYVLIQKVSFSTVDNMNDMELTAIPMKYSPLQQTQNEQESKMAVEEMYKAFQDSIKEDALKPINIGEANESVKQTVQQASSVADLSMELDRGQYEDYAIVSGDSLSRICQDKFSLPNLQGKLNGRNYNLEGWKVWYPVVIVCTYTRFKANTGAKPSYQISPASPDYIIPGNHLIIPNLTWKTVQNSYKSKVVGIMRTCYDYYNNINKTSWGQVLNTAADILERGEVTS